MRAWRDLPQAIMDVDRTGKGRNRRSNRWQAALKAVDVTFEGRLSTGRR